MSLVETRYAVPGWIGWLWREASLVVANDFGFGPMSDTVSDTDADDLIRRFHAFLRGDDMAFEDVSGVRPGLGDAVPERALAEQLRAVPRGEVVS